MVHMVFAWPSIRQPTFLGQKTNSFLFVFYFMHWLIRLFWQVLTFVEDSMDISYGAKGLKSLPILYSELQVIKKGEYTRTGKYKFCQCIFFIIKQFIQLYVHQMCKLCKSIHVSVCMFVCVLVMELETWTEKWIEFK